MNILTFNHPDRIEKGLIIKLKKQPIRWMWLFLYSMVVALFGILSLLIYNRLEPVIFYGEITFITLLVITVSGVILGSYGVINEIYKRPILILTPGYIYSGLRVLFRSPRVIGHGIIPKEDLKMVIVKESRSKRFRLILEGRLLIQLGIYNTLKEIEAQRVRLKTELLNFYPPIYVFSPIYQEI